MVVVDVAAQVVRAAVVLGVVELAGPWVVVRIVVRM